MRSDRRLTAPHSARRPVGGGGAALSSPPGPALGSPDGLRDLPALRTVTIYEVSNRTSFATINNLPALHTPALKACVSAPRNFRAVLRGQRLAAFKASLTRV